MDLIKRIQLWFRQHCDGEWEHSYGIKIDTIDNPGWSVKITLTDTILEDKPFSTIEYGDSEIRFDNRSYCECSYNEWINCYRDDEYFYGYSSPEKLEEILTIFLDWAGDNTDTDSWNKRVKELERRCNKKYFTVCNLSSVRALYQDIIDLPNEHPRKRSLLKEYLDNWDELKICL